MRNLTRTITMLLCLAIMLCVVPLSARASEQYDFVVDSNGVLVEYCGWGGDVVIPDYVTAVDDHAFSSNTEITSVFIPGTVTQIGEFAFAHCTNLSSVVLSEGLESIDANAFYGCPITEITLPSSLTALGNHAFSGCSELMTINIPDHLIIPYAGSVFYGTAYYNAHYHDEFFVIANVLINCTVTDSHIEIPEGVKYIASGNEFYNLHEHTVTSLTIPASVQTVERGAFYDLFDLETVTYAGSNTTFAGNPFSEDSPYFRSLWDGAYAVANGTIIGYRGNGDTVNIPESVHSIPESVFHYKNSDAILCINIHPGVTHIADNAFEHCYNAALFVESGSYAEQYAISHDLSYYTSGSEVEDTENTDATEESRKETTGNPVEEPTTHPTETSSDIVIDGPDDIGNGGAPAELPELPFKFNWGLIVFVIAAAAVLAFVIQRKK